MKVLLTYTHEDQTFTEVVETVSDDAITYTTTGINLGVSISSLLGTEHVWFEDEYGLFGMLPNDIISIEQIED